MENTTTKFKLGDKVRVNNEHAKFHGLEGVIMYAHRNGRDFDVRLLGATWHLRFGDVELEKVEEA